MIRKSRAGWMAVAIFVLAGGMSAAWLTGRVVARRDADSSRKAFGRSSAQVASKLRLAERGEQDLVVSAAAFFVGNPDATNAELAQWLRIEAAFARYPELLAISKVVVVRDSGLAAFTKRLRRDPPVPVPPGPLQIVPPGHRSYYCLLVTGLRHGSAVSPAGADYCAGDLGVLRTRDTSRTYTFPVTIQGFTVLGSETPIYRGGVAPRTVAGRRRAFLGLLGSAVAPSVVLEAALKGHPDLAVALQRKTSGKSAEFHAGKAPRNAHSMVIDLQNGSTLTTSGEVTSPSIWSDRHAVALALSGMLFSSALAALILILGLGRTRARRLIDLRTAELHATLLELEQTEREREALLAQTVEIAEFERTSIGGELHDGPIQSLTALAFGLDLLGLKIRAGSDDEARALARDLREGVAAEIASLRRLIGELRRSVNRPSGASSPA